MSVTLYKCDLCYNAFTNIKDLESHKIEVEHFRGANLCEHCGRFKTCRLELEQHIRLFHTSVEKIAEDAKRKKQLYYAFLDWLDILMDEEEEEEEAKRSSGTL